MKQESRVRLKRLQIRGYRSIHDEISICFPEDTPVVFVGENNAGKSNIILALDLILGESWPGSREPEDHDFWNRDVSDGTIEIVAWVDGVSDDRGPVNRFVWKYNPQEENEKLIYRASSPSGGVKYVRTELRDQLICVTIGADRRLSYQLSYASKWTLLSKLMRKFHASLVREEKRITRLKEKFQEIKNIFAEVEEFGEFQSGLAQQFSEMFSGTYGLKIDFSAYDPSNYFHSLKVLPHEGEETRTFEELGTGQEQLLALAFACAYARAFFGGIILVIEEPESHLHPLAQQWLAKKIRQMASDGLQIVITTHNPAFIDILGVEGIVLVRKEDGTTGVRQITAEELAQFCIAHGANQHRTTTETILPFYASSATQDILSGLFAKRVLLVEGPTEALSLPVYLSRVGLDVTKEGVAVIPVFGKGNLAKWWRFFRVYDIPTYLIFDNDGKKDDAKGDKRKDALRTLGVAESKLTEIISLNSWTIEDLYCVFGKDFETSLRASFSQYQNLEAQAKEEIGDAKPLVARFVAEKLQLSSDQGWKKFRRLKRKIENLQKESCGPTATDEDIPF